MNTKQILIALAVVTAMSATVVMAEDAAAPAPAAPAAAAPATGGHKGRHPMKFQDRKAKKLSNLEKAAAKIQQKQACAQAATDNASLDKCFPKRGEGKGKGKGKGGWHKHGKDGADKDGADKADTGDAAPAPAGK